MLDTVGHGRDVPARGMALPPASTVGRALPSAPPARAERRLLVRDFCGGRRASTMPAPLARFGAVRHGPGVDVLDATQQSAGLGCAAVVAIEPMPVARAAGGTGEAPSGPAAGLARRRPHEIAATATAAATCAGPDERPAVLTRRLATASERRRQPRSASAIRRCGGTARRMTTRPRARSAGAAGRGSGR